MSATTLLDLNIASLSSVADTLTRSRLTKYLCATNFDLHKALHLYVLNAKVSASVMTDLHYIEVALRNKFDSELSILYGREWYKDAQFLEIIDGRCQHILQKAQRDARKHYPKHHPLPPGKVIAELTFGFWHSLTDSKLEHKLWTPCLYKAFSPRKAPKRSSCNQKLEKLRQLRNRVAHHEPIFHLDLLDAHARIIEVGELLCPITTKIMAANSTFTSHATQLTKYSHPPPFFQLTTS